MHNHARLMPTTQMAVPCLAKITSTALKNLLGPITVPPASPDVKFSNWAQTFICMPLAVFEPETVYHCELILELARREGKTVRAVGLGHSPSDLACTSEYMVRTAKLNNFVEVSMSIGAYLSRSTIGPFLGSHMTETFIANIFYFLSEIAFISFRSTRKNCTLLHRVERLLIHFMGNSRDTDWP
jgi:hypothetical protein